MGRGNWRPSNDMESRGCRFIYVSDPEENNIDPDDFYWFLREKITDFLSEWKSWKQCEKYRSEGHQNTLHIFAENRMFEIFSADNETTTVIGIAVKENAPDFSAANIDGISRLLFNHIASTYHCYVRDGAWTSARYVIEE